MWPPNGVGISLYAFGRKSKLDADRVEGPSQPGLAACAPRGPGSVTSGAGDAGLSGADRSSGGTDQQGPSGSSMGRLQCSPRVLGGVMRQESSSMPHSPRSASASRSLPWAGTGVAGGEEAVLHPRGAKTLPRLKRRHLKKDWRLGDEPGEELTVNYALFEADEAFSASWLSRCGTDVNSRHYHRAGLATC